MENQVFTKIVSDEFGEIEVLLEDGKPYFPVGKIARIFGYENPDEAVKKYCTKDGCKNQLIIDSFGEKQVAKFIDKANSCRLMLNSKLPYSVKFKRWFNEISPIIQQYTSTIQPWKALEENPNGFLFTDDYTQNKKRE